ncbi:MAG: dihydropteroate synthase [Lachnospiraceae bacterium]|nr:dihydropteroate synthase [Lachnospiraceae bacterium]
MKIGKYDFDFDNNAYIMGILNVTPDSFSDGGKWNDVDCALFHTEKMIEEGADIIDVGGESTRPGYTQISDNEEIERVSPVIERIKKNFDVPVSLDTYKGAVAEAGINAGADLINDIWGLKYDDRMAQIIAQSNVACCLMHNRDNTDYKVFMDDVLSDLKETIEIALGAGISKDKIILDPGVGFAKSYEQNLEVINKCNRILELGYPVLLGTSRKSVIGIGTGRDKDNRVAGTVATTVIGYERGCRIFRVHDVAENFDSIKMASELLKL